MKRLLCSLLAFALILPCLLLFSACGTDGDGAGYTVKFSVNGNVTKVTVPAGEIPEYPGETSWETDEHYYTITGWDKEFAPATENVTYTATVAEYGLTVYSIRFNMPGGIVSVDVHEGETPTPPAGYETDLTKTGKVGTFTGWSPELVAPTAENMEGKKVKVYNPVYAYATRTYTITFNVKGTAHTVTAAHNTMPACPVDPASQNNRDGSFVGWDKKIVPASDDATYTAWYGTAAEVTPVKDGAKGMLTMTYDDGFYETAVWVNKENKKYGLNGSCMLVAGKSNLTDNLAKWKGLFAQGTLEPECHSMTHETMPADWSRHYQEDAKKAHNIQPKYKYELIDSKARLEELFPGHEIICFAPGDNTLSTASFAFDANGNAILSQPVNDGGAQKVASDTYYAIRQGKYGIQSLDPTFGIEEGSWYNLKIQWFREWWKNNSTNGITWLDDTVRNGGWLIVMCHTIIGEGASGTDSGSQDISTELADQFFAHAGNYVKSGDLWCATLGDATRYLREKQSATAYRHMENGVLYVGLKLDRTTPDGKPLDEKTFNYPLTVKAQVPAGWNSASYELNGKTVTANVQTDPANNQKYVLVNIVPGGDGAITTVRVTRVN